MIEVGRHKDIALENRTCTKCSANCIEDEIHLPVLLWWVPKFKTTISESGNHANNQQSKGQK